MTDILRQRLKPRHVDEVPLDLFGGRDDDLPASDGLPDGGLTAEQLEELDALQGGDDVVDVVEVLDDREVA